VVATQRSRHISRAGSPASLRFPQHALLPIRLTLRRLFALAHSNTRPKINTRHVSFQTNYNTLAPTAIRYRRPPEAADEASTACFPVAKDMSRATIPRGNMPTSHRLLPCRSYGWTADGQYDGFPPPPPRFPGPNAPSVMPPPPGPPPGAPLPQQHGWQNNHGRGYDGRQAYGQMMPHASTAQHQPYIPRQHAQVAGWVLPCNQSRLRRISHPARTLTGKESVFLAMVPIITVRNPIVYAMLTWKLTDFILTDFGTMDTLIDDTSTRDRINNLSALQARGVSNASSSTSVHTVAPEVAAQWPLNTVLLWLNKNQFSKQWQDTFRALNLQGGAFLELGSRHASRDRLGLMHNQVYPRLMWQCVSSDSGWDSAREREEGKRLRKLIRYIISGTPPDPIFTRSSHARKDSVSGAQVSSGATDKSESPNASNVCCIR